MKLPSLFNSLVRNKTVSGALKSKIVLYIIATLAMLNVFGYLAMYEYRSLLFFIVLGILTSLYSKNMIVVLAVAILGTNLLIAGYSKRFYITEGFENEDEEDENGGASGFENEDEEDENGGASGFQNKEKKEKKESKDKFTQRNVPKSINARVNEDPEDRIGKRVDYASTVEKAYNNLENILGGEGMKNLTNDTQKLIKQQQSLMGTLKQMKPLISMAKDTMGSVDSEAMTQQLKEAKELLSGFQGKK